MKEKSKIIGYLKNLGRDREASLASVFKANNTELKQYYFTAFPLYDRVLNYLEYETELLDKDDLLYRGDLESQGIYRLITGQHNGTIILSHVNLKEDRGKYRKTLIRILRNDGLDELKCNHDTDDSALHKRKKKLAEKIKFLKEKFNFNENLLSNQVFQLNQINYTINSVELDVVTLEGYEKELSILEKILMMQYLRKALR